MYRIVQEEPEGWSKAFVIYFDDTRILCLSYRDTAEWFVKEMLA